MEKNIEQISPPYRYIEEDKKNILGYLFVKRTVMEIKNRSRLKSIFDIDKMKPAFQWFDLEDSLSLWSKIFSIYYHKTSNYEDSGLYTLTDFIVFYINYCPDTFISIISKHLKQNYLSPEDIKDLNKIFLRLGYQYENGIFCSTSSIPEKRLEINSLIDFKPPQEICLL